jgi:hypothetical protein
MSAGGQKAVLDVVCVFYRGIVGQVVVVRHLRQFLLYLQRQQTRVALYSDRAVGHPSSNFSNSLYII